MEPNEIPESRGHGIPALPYPTTVQKVAYTGTKGDSNAFGAGVTIVQLVATTACHYEIGASPTATTADMYLPAEQVIHVKVDPGDSVSVIQVSSGGTLYVGEIKVGN